MYECNRSELKFRMTMAHYMNGHTGQMLPLEITENGTFLMKEKHCRTPTPLPEEGKFTVY